MRMNPTKNKGFITNCLCEPVHNGKLLPPTEEQKIGIKQSDNKKIKRNPEYLNILGVIIYMLTIQ